MKCIYCNEDFIPNNYPTTRHFYCSAKCRKKSWSDKNRERLNKESNERYKNNPEHYKAIKRKYNWSEKGKAKKKNWYQEHKDITLKRLNKYSDKTKSRVAAKRIIAKFKTLKICSCKTPVGRIEIHHKDNNPINNSIDNLIYLCRKCHMALHCS